MSLTVYVTSREEWDRILAARTPSPLYVSDTRESFRNGLGMEFIFVRISA